MSAHKQKNLIGGKMKRRRKCRANQPLFVVGNRALEASTVAWRHRLQAIREPDYSGSGGGGGGGDR